jgi:hypothetical protein
MALTEGMRSSLNVEDARALAGPSLIALAFLLLFAAAIVTTWIKNWRNKLAVCLLIAAIALMTF